MMKDIRRRLVGTEPGGVTSVGGIGRRNAKRRKFDARDDVVDSGLIRGARSTSADNGVMLSKSP